MKPRFSLKFLFCLTACLAVVCWHRQQPQRMARQLVEAIDSKQYAAADGLFSRSQDRQFVTWQRYGKSVQLRYSFESQSWIDWLRGRCAGQYHAQVEFGPYGIYQEGTLLAAAAGIVTTSARATRLDRPTLAEQIKSWLPEF